jgi:hypothetical protein
LGRERIDEMLQDAVAAGAVPNAVAVAADRSGLIYEGAAGPRVVGVEATRSVPTAISVSCR